MKFGRRLREQSDAFDDDAVEHVVDYKKLKKLIGQLRTSKDQGEDVTERIQAWLTELQSQVQRFETFFRARMDELRESVAGTSATNIGQRNDDLANAVKDLYVQTQELKFFAEMNRTGVRKILKKLDKNMGTTGTPQSEQTKFQTQLTGLSVSQMDAEMIRFGTKLASVYAATQAYRKLSEQRALQELDYHVNCVSDLFSYMLGQGAAASKGLDRAGSETSMPSLGSQGPPQQLTPRALFDDTPDATPPTKPTSAGGTPERDSSVGQQPEQMQLTAPLVAPATVVVRADPTAPIIAGGTRVSNIPTAPMPASALSAQRS